MWEPLGGGEIGLKIRFSIINQEQLKLKQKFLIEKWLSLNFTQKSTLSFFPATHLWIVIGVWKIHCINNILTHIIIQGVKKNASGNSASSVAGKKCLRDRYSKQCRWFSPYW